MVDTNTYAAVQNGVVLGVYDTYEEAKAKIEQEIKADWLTIMFTKKLRKLFRKSGNVALHKYSIIHVTEVEEVK